jgi:hypothetical protein
MNAETAHRIEASLSRVGTELDSIAFRDEFERNENVAAGGRVDKSDSATFIKSCRAGMLNSKVS